MHVRILASACVLSLAVSPAAAQEKTHFTGLDVALIGGYDSIDLSDEAVSLEPSGIMYGLSLGYNVGLGPIIAGLEAEAAFSNIRSSARHIFYTADNITVSTSRDIYIGPRLGAKIAENVLIFAKGGYTNVRLNATYNDGFDLFRDAKNMHGFRIGTGVEYSFKHFGIRAEYRYSDYGVYGYDYNYSGVSMKRRQVTAGIFGRF